MNVAIVNTYSYRPHNEHLIFLKRLLDKTNNNVFLVGCNGGATSCNTLITKKIKNSSKLTCLICKEFGLKAFHKLDHKVSPKPLKDLNKLDSEIPLSTLFTSSRAETPNEVKNIKTSPHYRTLLESTNAMKYNFQEFIQKQKIDFVFGFNGRMDLMRAIRFASRDLKIPFIGVERPWFGKGMLLTPNEGPLGTGSLTKIWNQFKNKPLTSNQIDRALLPVAKRKLKSVQSEFMSFNDNHIETEWKRINPDSKIKVLFLPSSRMEHLSEFQRKSNEWDHPLEGLTYLFTKGIINKKDIIIRFHPIWAKNIFGKDAKNCINYYKTYCRKHGISYVSEISNILTASLIEESDVVVLNGGSAFFEASVLGKPIISMSRSFYDSSGYQKNIFSKSEADKLKIEDLLSLNKEEPIRVAIRFLYCFQFRYHQLIEEVFHKSAKKAIFRITEKGVKTIHSIINNGRIEAYDSLYASSINDENKIIESIKAGNIKWTEVIGEELDLNQFFSIKRNNKIKEMISGML